MKTIPKIQKYMTTLPHTIGLEISLQKALEMMRTHQIRHLPVMDGGVLKGILTDRDIKLAASFKGAAELTVEDVMTPDPYTTTPDAALNTVVNEMAEHKFGCAVVQSNHKVVGIFTEIDALKALAEVLRENYRTEAH